MCLTLVSIYFNVAGGAIVEARRETQNNIKVGISVLKIVIWCEEYCVVHKCFFFNTAD